MSGIITVKGYVECGLAVLFAVKTVKEERGGGHISYQIADGDNIRCIDGPGFGHDSGSIVGGDLLSSQLGKRVCRELSNFCQSRVKCILIRLRRAYVVRIQVLGIFAIRVDAGRTQCRAG